MDTKPQEPSQKTDPKDSNLGISFNEVHSDEPQDEITAEQTEMASRYTSNDSHLTNHDDVFNVSKAFDGEHVETGTIVTDRRKQRPSFTSNLRSAFHEWWGKTHTTLSKTFDEIPIAHEVDEKPVVQKSETRTEVIQKAVIPAQLAPIDDHVVVVEKIRTFKQDMARATGSDIVIKEPAEKKNEWSHLVAPVAKVEEKVTKKQAPLITAPLPDYRGATIAPIVNVPAQYEVKNTAPVLTPPQPVVPPMIVEQKKVPLPPIHVPSTILKKTITPPKNPVVITPTVTISVPGLHQKPMPRVSQESVKPTWQTSVEEKIVPPQTPEKTVGPVVNSRFRSSPPPPPPIEQERRNSDRPAPAPSNTLLRMYARFAILGGVSILGIILAVVVSLNFNIFTRTDAPVSETPTAPELVLKDTEFAISFATGKQDFLNTLRNRVASAPQGLTEFYPTVPDGTVSRQLATDEFLSLLSVNLPGKAIRALDKSFVVGSITASTNEPFIVIRSYNFDELFAGMLVWEPTLFADLSPLFGATETVSSTFKDTVRQNLPVRILTDAEGNEILVYSFVSQNTVVITKSSVGLSRVIEKL